LIEGALNVFEFLIEGAPRDLEGSSE
jgi:hypothetical protein